MHSLHKNSFNSLTCSSVLLLAVSLALPVCAAAASNDSPDLEVVTEIRQEGFRHSQVMNILSDLTDRIGPRLTGSPNMKKANEWTRDQFTSWGLTNAHLESWGPFGRGWSNEFVSVRMTAPDTDMLLALPKAWTPGTNGVVSGDVVLVKIDSKDDIEQYRGKLAGKIVLLGAMREVKPHSEVELERYDDKKLAEIAEYRTGGAYEGRRAEFAKRRELNKLIDSFLREEKPLAVIEPSRGDGGTLFVQGSEAYKKDAPMPVTGLVMAIEHYGRLARLLERKVPVQLELDVRNKWYDDDPNQYNTIAEIPGTDKKDEIVMVGAHLDSWHTGTGATDNASGSAVAMEAMRILKSLGVKPRRTIRIALWSGEEEGLYGSRAYVAQHFGSRVRDQKQASASDSGIPDWMRRDGKLVLKPEQAKVSAYFNLDNGTGKIRGIYLQENAAVRPIFTKWLDPFSDLGATTVTMQNTGSTDHVSFDAVGIPGFQFIQDPVEYMTRSHHSNMDVYERLQKEDLMQASVILASFIYDAAMRDEMLPRKPLPKDEPPQRQTNVAGTPAATTTGGN